MLRKFAILFFAFCAVASFTTYGQTTAAEPQTKADILTLFDAMHLRDRMQDLAHTLFESLRPMLLQSLPATPNRSEIAQSMVDKFAGILTSKETMDQMADIYAKHLSDDDVKELTKFYQSPAGQHFNDAAPQLTTEGSQLGQKLMLEQLPEIFKSLCTTYPELKGAANFCPKEEPQKKGN